MDESLSSHTHPHPHTHPRLYDYMQQVNQQYNLHDILLQFTGLSITYAYNDS